MKLEDFDLTMEEIDRLRLFALRLYVFLIIRRCFKEFYNFALENKGDFNNEIQD